MPLPMQLRSCSMRSGVQVALEGAMLLLAGAMIAGSIAGAGIGSDGAIDGDMRRPRSIAAAGLGRRQGVRARAAGNREKAKPRSENRCAASRADPEKDAPDVTQAGGSRSAEKNQPHQATKAK